MSRAKVLFQVAYQAENKETCYSENHGSRVILECRISSCLVLELQGAEEDCNSYSQNANNRVIIIFSGSCGGYVDECNIELRRIVGEYELVRRRHLKIETVT